MPEIGETVYFTMNGTVRGQEIIWAEGEFLGLTPLGPAEKLSYRVKVAEKEINLSATAHLFTRPIRLIGKGRQDQDFCVDPETRLWALNFSNEIFMLTQVNKIADEQEGKNLNGKED